MIQYNSTTIIIIDQVLFKVSLLTLLATFYNSYIMSEPILYIRGIRY